MAIPKSAVLSIFISLNIFISTNSIAQNTNSASTTKEKIPSSLAPYEKYMDDHNDAHLKEYLELVSIPTISSIPSHKPDIAKAAAWIGDKLKAIGITNGTADTNRGEPGCIWQLERSPG